MFGKEFSLSLARAIVGPHATHNLREGRVKHSPLATRDVSTTVRNILLFPEKTCPDLLVQLNVRAAHQDVRHSAHIFCE